MNSLDAVCRDNHLQIAAHLAQEPRTSTAWVPSLRSWGSTNTYFRALLFEAGWLAPANVCNAKFAQALDFSCPALRVLNLAAHFAPALPLQALMAMLQTLPGNRSCPKHSVLPLMLVNRAGKRLPPATRAALLASVAQSPYALPVDDGTQRWTFGKPERQALKRFIGDCFGVFHGGDFHVLLASGERYFADDCMAVVLNLPLGLQALALHDLSYCAEELLNGALEEAVAARADILFDIEALIPQQWSSALVDHTCYPLRSLDQCLRSVLIKASPRTTADICRRVVRLMRHFLDGLPRVKRHWTRLQKACSTDELRLFQGLARLLHDHLGIGGVRGMYLRAALRSGLITRAEWKSPQAMEKFQAWCMLENAPEGMLKAFLRQQVQASGEYW